MDLDALVNEIYRRVQERVAACEAEPEAEANILELWERKINLCLVSYLRIMERFATKSMNVNNWQSIIG